MARVSILLPVRNGASFIETALTSLLNQTYCDFEILVLNHGSTDRTEDIIQVIKSKSSNGFRIRVISVAEQPNLSAVLNEGIRQSSGELIARMDHDDISSPERLALQVQAFESDPNLTICGAWASVISANGAHRYTLRMPSDEESIRIALPFFNPFIHPTVMMRKTHLDRDQLAYGINRIFDFELAGLHCEDYLLFSQLALLGKAINLRQSLIKYRTHQTNVSRQKADLQLFGSVEISKALFKEILGVDVAASVCSGIVLHGTNKTVLRDDSLDALRFSLVQRLKKYNNQTSRALKVILSECPGGNALRYFKLPLFYHAIMRGDLPLWILKKIF